MATTAVSTRDPARRLYGVKHSVGTMGILLRGDHSECEVLLIHRRLKTPEIQSNGPPDSWWFPGGGADADETPEEAIVREFSEEVGLDGQTDDYLDKPWCCFLYVVEQLNPEQQPQVMEKHKHVALEWIRWDKMWDMIKAGMAACESETGSSSKDSAEEMRFFPTMHNMVKKYPNRSNIACLKRHL
ncbi:NUDIX hydrolase domain-like protein [Parachaetomium inaequale]|uniref:NUDIX hydrolase domain-like protein n=1 Tax=Parachaetomium inaequale TaxID=2588326 RepID=A0AAN6P5Z8_9PEZI|nr:NUDIX hydrolase domain-like protein [Parachaetomium inaequale]